MISTGNDVLDDALTGGFPEGRTVLVTGGPGTGKSTLAMQFLQKGLDNGEDTLLISTEQTHDELRDSFSSFDFDLEHDRLKVTTIHAKKGNTIENGEEEDDLVLKTLEGGDMMSGKYSAPFEVEYIKQYLEEYEPVDRIVLDSVSGMRPMGKNDDVYRRSVLELIRFFNDDFGATTLMTAEETNHTRTDVETVGRSDLVKFNAHGVLRLWRENVRGDYHRYIEIIKMRGIDHDTRVYEIEFDTTGVRIVPRYRTYPGNVESDKTIPTGIDGLDIFMGGGIISGGTLLLEHDGEAGIGQIVAEMLIKAFNKDMAIMLVPPIDLPPKRFGSIFDRIKPMDTLLEQDRLFLLDFPNIWKNTHKNVFKPMESDEGIKEIYQRINERVGDRPLFSLISVEAMLPTMESDEICRVRFWEEENFFGAEDTSVYFFNPKTVSEETSEFYKNSAWQVIDTWRNDRGLQYVKLKKSPRGYVGSTRYVEYSEEKPYVHVQKSPSGGRVK